MDPMRSINASTPITTQVKTNGAATFVKSVAAAIVAAIRGYPKGNGSLMNEPEGICERRVHSDPRMSSFLFICVWFISRDSICQSDALFVDRLGRSVVRGLSVSSHPCVLITVAP